MEKKSFVLNIWKKSDSTVLLAGLFSLMFILAACGSRDSKESAVDEKDSKTASDHYISYGDILMRSLRVWPADDEDERNTLEAAKAFKVDKIVWIYENSPEYNQKVRNEGIEIGSTMNHNAR